MARPGADLPQSPCQQHCPHRASSNLCVWDNLRDNSLSVAAACSGLYVHDLGLYKEQGREHCLLLFCSSGSCILVGQVSWY